MRAEKEVREREQELQPKGRRRRVSLLPKRCREENGRVRTASENPLPSAPHRQGDEWVS